MACLPLSFPKRQIDALKATFPTRSEGERSAWGRPRAMHAANFAVNRGHGGTYDLVDNLEVAMADATPLAYAAYQPRVSRLAVTSMILGIVSLPLFFLVVPGLIALVFAWAANHALGRSPERLGGAGFLAAGRTLGATSLFLGMGFLLFVPARHHGCRASNRNYCAANLRGIMQSMNVYGTDNSDTFPLVPYPRYEAAHNNPTATLAPSLAGPSDKEAALDAMYRSPPANIAGSPVASVWVLVLRDYLSPKQLVCKSDPFVKGPAPAISRGGHYTNVSHGSQLSYSVAYPWTVDGKGAPWWSSNLVDSSLPLVADMAPLQGSGKPARVLNPSSAPTDALTWSSANHTSTKEGRASPGQNVGFSDAHVEWVRSPTAGHDDDNIYTTSGTGAPAKFGGVPATPLFPPPPPRGPGWAKFDVILVPVRDAGTGAM